MTDDERDTPGGRPPAAAGHPGPGAGHRPSAELLDLGPEGTTAFVKGSLLFGRTLIRCFTRVEVEGLERAPRSGPLIIASNHLSNADPLLMACWLTPALGRAVHWMAKQEALEWPIAGPFLRANGAFGIRRGAADTEAFRLAKRVLEEGRVLGTFPEGTRSRTGRLQQAKEGVTLLAVRTGAPILPVACWGTERFWPRGRKVWGFGGRIHLHVGEPFLLARGTTDGRREDLEAVTTRLMTRIAALLPPGYRGDYLEAASGAREASGAAVSADVAAHDRRGGRGS